MHELPITESILEIILRHAERAGATRVTQIDLVIGDLSSIVDDSIQFYFDILSKDTIAQDARLVFNRMSAQLRCRDCQTTFAPDGHDYLCPECGSGRVQVIGGREFQVESIEVE